MWPQSDLGFSSYISLLYGYSMILLYNHSLILLYKIEQTKLSLLY